MIQVIVREADTIMSYFHNAVRVLAFFVAMIVSAMSWANTVAVVDTRAAMLDAKVAKKNLADLDQRISADRARISALQQEMSALEAAFQKKRKTMSEAEKKQMQHQAEEKLQEYNKLGASVQQRIEASQSKLLKELMPKLRAGIAHVQKKHGIDIIIPKSNVYSVTNAWDMTSQVTEYIDNH